MFILIGFIVHIIGFGAPYWQVVGSKYKGLWQDCSNVCSKIDIDDFTKLGFNNWLQTVRTFECVGLIGSFVVIVFIGLYICVGSCSGRKCIAILNVILCFATGGVIIVAIIIYGSKTDHLDWAFGLATGGGVCYVIAGIFLIVSMRSN